MAADSDVIAADAVELELEAMKKDDCSWHPCQVYLSPNDTGLVINYGNNGSKEILVNEKEALTRLRARSLPLRDDDCTHIKEGEHVVVDKNSESESCFFDAEVEKVSRVRHSKRMNCRCTFMIKWLHQDLHSGSLTVPSSSIMRLANKSIINHPTISAFIDAVPLGNSSFSCMSPQLNVVNDIDLDLHDLLEKQIEGIRNSVHGSKKKTRDEILGFEAYTNEQVKETNISISNVKDPEIQISTHTGRLTRSSRSREALKRAEVKPIPPEMPSPSIEEDKKSPLNPLAARAALASLMSKLPRTLEFSLDHEEPKGFTEFSLKAEATNFTTNVTQMSPEMETRLTRAKKVKGIPDDNSERSSRTVTNKRFTRSLLHKEEEIQTIETTSVVENDIISDHNVMTESDKETPFKMEKGIEGTKNSSNTRRITRSLVNKDTANLEKESVKEVVETNGKIDSLPTERRNKKRNITSQDSEGNVGVTSDGSRKSSRNLKKHEVRSSPRTQSQNKA